MIGIIGLEGIMIIDITTLLFAIVALLAIHIPQPETTEAGRAEQGSLLKESFYGFQYIAARPSLLGLLLIFTWSNLAGGFAMVLSSPMILARTGSDELILAAVQSALAIGGLVGSLLISVWGGPQRRNHGVLLSMLGLAVLGGTVLGLGRGVVVWALGSFFIFFFISILNSSSQAIWQAKFAPDVQGRVFATRRLIAQITFPLGVVLAGPLADKVFEPALAVGGSLAGSLGRIVGTGPGAGMSAIVLIASLAASLSTVVGYAIPAIRNVESIIPYFEPQIKPESEMVGESGELRGAEAGA